MTFTLVMSIILAVLVTVVILSAQKDAEREAEQKRNLEEAIEADLFRVRNKYAGSELPSRYHARRHADYTGGTPLTPEKLEALKMEISR